MARESKCLQSTELRWIPGQKEVLPLLKWSKHDEIQPISDIDANFTLILLILRILIWLDFRNSYEFLKYQYFESSTPRLEPGSDMLSLCETGTTVHMSISTYWTRDISNGALSIKQTILTLTTENGVLNLIAHLSDLTKRSWRGPDSFHPEKQTRTSHHHRKRKLEILLYAFFQFIVHHASINRLNISLIQCLTLSPETSQFHARYSPIRILILRSV